MSFIEDLRGLDFEDPGGWPPVFKVIAALLVIAIIAGAGYQFKIKNDLESYETIVRKEKTLRDDFARKQRKAAQLDAYCEQFGQINEKLEELLKQLPTKTQIPQLLQTVSKTAIETGIDVERFEPQAEIIKDVFAERPIALQMDGSFHQFGRFVSEIADERRVIILTMHDLKLQPNEAGGLNLQGTAKTYRSVDADDEVNNPNAAAAARTQESPKVCQS